MLKKVTFSPAHPSCQDSLFSESATLRMLSRGERCLVKGTSLGKEAGSADSGWVGEVGSQGRAGEKGDWFQHPAWKPAPIVPVYPTPPLFWWGLYPLSLGIVEILECGILRPSQRIV